MEFEHMEDFDLCTGHYGWSFPHYYRNGTKYWTLQYEAGNCSKAVVKERAKIMDENYERSKKSVKKQVHDYITHSFQRDHGIFMATLIHSQHSAIDALKELGAEHSDWIVKHQHSDTKVAVFWIDIHKYNVERGIVTPHEEEYPEMYKSELSFYEG